MSTMQVDYNSVASFERLKEPERPVRGTHLFTAVLLAVFFVVLMIGMAAGVAMYSAAKGTKGAKKVYQYVKSKTQHRYSLSKISGFSKSGGIQFYAPKSGKKCYEWTAKVGGKVEYKYSYTKPAKASNGTAWKKTGKYLYAVK